MSKFFCSMCDKDVTLENGKCPICKADWSDFVDEESYVKNKLDASFSNGIFKKVIIDLIDLSFMDSTGIGVLIGRYKQLKNKSIPIFITNPNKQIDKIFNMSGLYNIMPKLV